MPQAAMASVSVLACEPEWAALTRAIGVEHVEVTSATTHLQDPHYIQARPSLIAKARQADLLVCAGAELEIGWLPVLLKKSGNARIQEGQPGHFMATEAVDLLGKHEQVDRSMGDVHAAGNPHVHLGPQRVADIAQELLRRLQQIDPDNAERYGQAHEAFQRQWQADTESWAEKAESIRGQKVVVNHDNWIYLESWLGLKRLTTLEPKPGVEPSVKHLKMLSETVMNDPDAWILTADYQDRQAVDWLSQRTPLKVKVLPYTVQDGESIHAWRERLMRALLDEA